ncbi:hypothetical protein ACOMHN_034403 [Nucella lapillus]
MTGEKTMDKGRLSHTGASVQHKLGWTEEQMEYITRAFKATDSNGNGLISKTELERASRMLGYTLSKSEVDQMMASVDKDEIRRAFRKIDSNGNGRISSSELARPA